jgi:hypothetical protein
VPIQNNPIKAEKNRRERRRRALHQAVDRMIDGPASPDFDGWVLQVLEGLGSVFRAATPAL